MSALDIAEYLLKELKHNYETRDDEPFLFFFYENNLVKLNRPDPQHVGHFLAYLKFLIKLAPIQGILVRPWKMGEWLMYCVFKQGGWMRENVPKFARDDPSSYTWIEGIWTIARPPSGQSQYLLVVNKELSKMDEQIHKLHDKPFASTETTLRLDVEDYDPFNDKKQTYCQKLFYKSWTDYLPSLKKEFLDVSYTVNKMRKGTVKDAETLVNYIYSDINKNFIDVRDSININSNYLQAWLDMISVNPSETQKKATVLLLNRVFAFCKFSAKAVYAVKTYEAERGTHIIFWNKDNIQNFMRKFEYTEESKCEDVEEDLGIVDNGPPSRKRRRTETKVKTYQWFEYWIKSPIRGEIDGVVFQPWSLKYPPISDELYNDSGEYINFRKINEFQGYPVNLEHCKHAYMSEHGRKCIERFRDLVERVFCGGNETYYTYIYKWIAWILQKPHEKTKVAIVIRSQMGMGKGFIGKIFQHWFGNHFYLLSGTSPAQKFNNFLHRRKFVFIDEVKSAIGDMSILNSLITEETVAIEKKGIDQSNETNLVEFMGATNDPINIKLGTDTRRWVIIEAPTMEIPQLNEWKHKMVDNYNAFFKNGDGVWALMFFFLEYNIDGFIPFLHAPKTEAIKKCIEYSLHPVHAWWKYVLEHRQIDHTMVAGSPIENSNWTWPDLWVKLRKNYEWDQIYGYKSRLMETDFKEQLTNIAEIVYYDGRTNFRFRPWRIQIEKWERLYPDVTLGAKYIDPEGPDPFTKTLLEEMRAVQPIPGLNEYTDDEKNYIITKLTAKISEIKPEIRVVLNPSLYSRKKDTISNKKIIEFT